jgi:hypothetical protein
MSEIYGVAATFKSRSGRNLKAAPTSRLVEQSYLALREGNGDVGTAELFSNGLIDFGLRRVNI